MNARVRKVKKNSSKIGDLGWTEDSHELFLVVGYVAFHNLDAVTQKSFEGLDVQDWKREKEKKLLPDSETSNEA